VKSGCRLVDRHGGCDLGSGSLRHLPCVADAAAAVDLGLAGCIIAALGNFLSSGARV
jgi:hypothetical protein